MNKTFTFDADHPEIFASEDKGATPVDYVLVGLASCLTAGIAAVAQHRNIQLRSVTATIEGDMDVQGFSGGRPRRLPVYEAPGTGPVLVAKPGGWSGDHLVCPTRLSPVWY